MTEADRDDAPLSLEGLAADVDLLDAVLAFRLGDARLYAAWVRPEAGVRAEEVTATLRDLYRVAQFAARRLGAEPHAPVLTLEVDHRTAILRRVRAHVVACVFDAAMPLGMARLIGDRVTAVLGPELPLETTAPAQPSGSRELQAGGSGASTSSPRAPSVRDAAAKPAASAEPPAPAAPPSTAGDEGPATSAGPGALGADARADASTHAIGEVSASTMRVPEEPAVRHGPSTLAFGSALPRRSRPPPAMDRIARLIAHLEAHAPDPHVVRLRLALRAGLTQAALDRPELLGPEVVVLVETAVQDILGVDRAELRRIA